MLSVDGSSFQYGLGLHFLASLLLKSLYVMTPAALQMEIAATHTIDYLLSDKLTEVSQGEAYLYGEEKEVEVKIHA